MNSVFNNNKKTISICYEVACSQYIYEKLSDFFLSNTFLSLIFYEKWKWENSSEFVDVAVLHLLYSDSWICIEAPTVQTCCTGVNIYLINQQKTRVKWKQFYFYLFFLIFYSRSLFQNFRFVLFLQMIWAVFFLNTHENREFDSVF